MISKEFKTEAPLSIKKAWLSETFDHDAKADGSVILEANDDSRVIIPRKLIPTLREFIIKVEKEIKR